jgi:hypothetical protein
MQSSCLCYAVYPSLHPFSRTAIHRGPACGCSRSLWIAHTGKQQGWTGACVQSTAFQLLLPAPPIPVTLLNKAPCVVGLFMAVQLSLLHPQAAWQHICNGRGIPRLLPHQHLVRRVPSRPSCSCLPAHADVGLSACTKISLKTD